MKKFKVLQNQKGEGVFKLLLLAALLIGGGYFALQYFGLLGDKTSTTASSPSTLNGGQPIAGSPAGAAVQGTEAAGEVMGSGR